jgi:hypothetical protein
VRHFLHGGEFAPRGMKSDSSLVCGGFTQTVTFGWIFKHLLGGKATSAMLVAGVLLALAAVQRGLEIARQAEGAASDRIPS